MSPAFLGATERTPGLVVFEGLCLLELEFLPPAWPTHFLPGPEGVAFFKDPCTILCVRGW